MVVRSVPRSLGTLRTCKGQLEGRTPTSKRQISLECRQLSKIVRFWLLGYGYNFIFNARPVRSEQMEGAYQRCSADVQALGRQQVPQSMYDPVTNQ